MANKIVSNVAGRVVDAGLSAVTGVTQAQDDTESPLSKTAIMGAWQAVAVARAQNPDIEKRQLTEDEVEAAEEEGVSVVQAEDGSFETSVNTKRMADVLGVDEQLIIDDLNMTPLEKEQNPYTKSDLSDTETILYNEDGTRLDVLKHNETVEMFGCEVTGKDAIIKSGPFGVIKTETKVAHVKSDYLGEFDYDTSEFALGYKELEDGSKLPVLQYIGGRDGANAAGIAGFDLFMAGSDVGIPDGLKSMDYMFTGNDHLKYVPPIPDSVTSMHYAFAGCSSLEFSTDCSDLPDGFLNLVPSWTAELDGYTVRLPDGLEDMSGAFKDCSKLNVTFAANSATEGAFGGDYSGLLPEALVNLTEAFSGCENLSKRSSMSVWVDGAQYPQYGDDVTPYLTSAYAKDALNKITDEEAKKHADSREYIVDEDGQVDEDKKKAAEESGVEIDDDKLDETKVRSREALLRGVHDGIVASDPELSSGGARSNNYYYNAAEDGIADDVTGLMVSDKKPGTFSSIWQRAAIDGVAGLGIAGVANKLTGSGLISTIAGVGGAVALDYFDVIPESFLPILNWTKDLLPEGKWKEKMVDFIDNMTGSTIREQQSNLTAENVAATYQNRRLQRSLWGVKGAYELGDIDASMYNNAEYCAVNLNFKATADRALVDGEDVATAGAKGVVHEAVSSMENMWKSKAESGEDMVAQKAAMQDYYIGLMSALESYNNGANKGMQKMMDQAYAKVSEQGLGMLNRAYTGEVMESLKAMDAEYGFMDDTAWNKIAAMGISGVDIRNIKEFDAEKSAQLSSQSLMATQAIIAEAGEEYKTGVVLKPRDGESFYNEGKFYNEDAPTARIQELADALGDAAKDVATEPDAESVEEDLVPQGC